MDTAGISDGELFEACTQGDRVAFGQVVARYQCLISTIAYNLTGDLTLSEDVAQETFMAAWKQLGELRDPLRLKAWLCAIARNVARSSLRQRGRGVAGHATPLENVAESQADEPGPSDQAISKEEQSLLWRALEEIPPTYREPLVLYYREEKSAAAVAEALDLSVDAVKQRLSRGRKMLKAQVAAFVEETLSRTRPTKAFTVAVLAALPAAAPQTAAAGVVATATKGSAAAKAAVATGLLGAVLGPLIGLMGAALGITASIVNTRSEPERRFMVRMAGVVIGYVLLFFAVFFPTIWCAKPIIGISPWLLAGLLIAEVVAYVVGLGLLIIWVNRRQRQIQIEEGTWVDPAKQLPKMASGETMAARSGFAGAILGSVLGSLCWIMVVAWNAQDWWAAGLVLAAGLIVSTISIRVCRRAPKQYWRVLMADMAAVAVINLLAINLRWDALGLSSDGRVTGYPVQEITRWGLNGLVVLLFVPLCLWFYARDRKTRQDGNLNVSR